MKKQKKFKKNSLSNFTKSRTNFFNKEIISKIDYKNVKLLSKYITEKGKIMPSRITKHFHFKIKKKISSAIKRARYIALLSYSRKI